MISINYEWSVDLQKLFQGLSFEKQKSSARRALSRATQSMRKIAVSEVTRVYRITAQEVRKSITLTANANSAIFSVRGKRLGGEKFKFSPGKSGRKHSPLKLSVRKDTSPKPLPRAFIMKRTGSMLRRIDSEKFPIERVTSPAIPQMIGNNPEVVEAMKNAAQDTFSKVLAHELKRALDR